MAIFDKTVTADRIIAALYATDGLFRYGNSFYNGLVSQGANTVIRPKLATLKCVKNPGSGDTDTWRKQAKKDTTPVTSVLDQYTVPFGNEVINAFETNNVLVDGYIAGALDATREQWDTDFIAAGMATAHKYNGAAAGELTWNDFSKVKSHMTKMKLPKGGNRLTLVDADLEEQFWDIDVIKKAASYSVLQLGNNDQIIKIQGNLIFITSLMEKLEGKPCIVGIHGTGLASIISRFGEMKQAYDTTNTMDVIDFHSHAKFELDDEKYACVVQIK